MRFARISLCSSSSGFPAARCQTPLCQKISLRWFSMFCRYLCAIRQNKIPVSRMLNNSIVDWLSGSCCIHLIRLQHARTHVQPGWAITEQSPIRLYECNLNNTNGTISFRIGFSQYPNPKWCHQIEPNMIVIAIVRNALERHSRHGHGYQSCV